MHRPPALNPDATNADGRREFVPEHHGIVPHLLKEPTHPEGIDDEFLREAVSRFDEEETLPEVFTQAMVSISNKLSTMSMETNYQPYVRVCSSLASPVL